MPVSGTSTSVLQRALTKYLPGELREQGANITLMLHSDMLAYHVPGEHAQLAFPKFVDLNLVAHGGY